MHQEVKTKFVNAVKYYFEASERRKILDKLSAEYSSVYKGIVMDIGGRDKGKFKKPKLKVQKWIFADIEPKHNPDIVLNVSNMNNVESKSVDIINAMELFEHVEKIEKGISECFRVLKKSGKLIISVPFLYPVHADPYDFQRWTQSKWINELEKTGFEIEVNIIMGRFFSVRNAMQKVLIKSLPPIIRHLAYLMFPVFDLISKLDNTSFIKNHKKLGAYHGGYFIIARK